MPHLQQHLLVFSIACHGGLTGIPRVMEIPALVITGKQKISIFI
jgi:hypothetical protein